MSKVKKIELTLNQKYALTEVEIKTALAEAKRQGKPFPDFNACRKPEDLPEIQIMETLKTNFPGREFYSVKRELRNIVIEYDGKKLHGIKDLLRPYLIN